MRDYMELLDESVRQTSGGAVRLVPVPDELRVSPSSLTALQVDMWEARKRSVAAWNSSERNAADRGMR